MLCSTKCLHILALQLVHMGEGLVHEVHDLVPDSWTDPDRGNENSRNQLIYLVVSQYDIYMGKGKTNYHFLMNKLPLPMNIPLNYLGLLIKIVMDRDGSVRFRRFENLIIGPLRPPRSWRSFAR